MFIHTQGRISSSRQSTHLNLGSLCLNDKRCFLPTLQCDQGPNTKVQAHNIASNGWNETLEQRGYWKVSSIIRNFLQAHSKLGKQRVTSSICELRWIWREEFQENNWYKAYNAAQYNWITFNSLNQLVELLPDIFNQLDSNCPPQIYAAYGDCRISFWATRRWGTANLSQWKISTSLYLLIYDESNQELESNRVNLMYDCEVQILNTMFCWRKMSHLNTVVCNSFSMLSCLHSNNARSGWRFVLAHECCGT